MDDILDYTADVAMAFGVIESAELGRSLVQARVGRCFLTSVRLDPSSSPSLDIGVGDVAGWY